MTRLRFVHAADLHLDTPFDGIGRTAPQVAERLRDASLEAWDALVRFTIEQQAAALLLAGDIYDGADRGVRAQLRLHAGLAELSARGVSTFIVHGNHDPLDGWSAIRRWPERVTVFSGEGVHTAPLERDGETIATIYGVSYPRRDVTDNLALGFSRRDGPGLHIGLLHCNVGANPEHDLYSPCAVDDLARAGLDYWALGHVHRAAVLRDREPAVVYAGCLQGRSSRVFDQGVKGAMLVEADVDARTFDVQFHALDRVRFFALDVDVTGCDDIAALQRLLLEEAVRLRHENADRGLLVRATLRGRGDVHPTLQRPGALDALTTVLRQDAELDRPFLWWDVIVDRTAPAIDIGAIRERGDFSAELLKVADALAADPRRLDEVLAAVDDPLTRAGVYRWMAVERERTPELLQEASRVALELLDADT
jgi:DNA repair exonuclease SbcCD nuclease subunit